MGVAELLWTLRRRWRIIALMLAVALAIGWATVPSEEEARASSRKEFVYEAELFLLAPSAAPRDRQSLDRYALLMTKGDIPESVAAEIGEGEWKPPPGVDVAEDTRNAARRTRIGGTQVIVDPEGTVGGLPVTAIDGDSKRAEEVAVRLARALLDRLEAENQAEYDFVYAKLDQERGDRQGEVEDALAIWSSDVGNLEFQSAYQSSLRLLNDVESEIRDLRAKGVDPVPLTMLTVDPDVIQREVGAGVSVPTDRPTRLALAGFLGLLLGIGVAFMMDRLDQAVYGVSAVEQASHLPVIAEIPYVSPGASRRRYDVFTDSAPQSSVAEAYRGLRTSISLMWGASHPSIATASGNGNGSGSGYSGNGNGNGSGGGGGPALEGPEPRVLLVTSPGPNEGKSTSTANLAACYAEMGKRVVLIDSDYRRQKLHRFMGASREPHMVLGGTPQEPLLDIDVLLQDAVIPGVQFIGSAPSDARPSDALIAARLATEQAFARGADLVLIDTPPLLLTNDAYDLIGLADAIVLLARDGKTKRAALVRVTQMLRRLDAPVMGIALIGAVSSRRGYGYGYGYEYEYEYGYGYGSRPRSRETKPARKGARGNKPTRDEGSGDGEYAPARTEPTA